MSKTSSLALLVVLGATACAPEAAWVEEDGYRWRELRPPTSGLSRVLSGDGEGFTRLGNSGIDHTNRVDPELSLTYEHLHVGSGVAIADVNGDGLRDVYLGRTEGPNALFLNRGGFRFEEVTEQAGVAADGRFTTGVAFSDVDGDGDPDLLVAAMGGPNALFLNDGEGRFREATTEAGLDRSSSGMTMSLADIDGDGDVDLYVANHKKDSAADVLLLYERSNLNLVVDYGDSLDVNPEFREHFRMEERYGERIAVEQADPDFLFLNDGTGHFTEADWTDGRFLDVEGQPLERAVDDYALAARFYDVDGDGDPDLYVCHDFDDPDVLWLNQGDGTFRFASPLAIRNTSHSSMAVDFADIDRNGTVDFFVADMRSRSREMRLRQELPQLYAPKFIGLIEDSPQYPRNTLHLNRGDGTFAQIADLAGLDASEWTWGSLFVDVDLDGFEDLIVTNGHGRDMQDADALARIASMRGRVTWRESKSFYPEMRGRNMAFRNRGDLTFEEVGVEWGLGDELDVSHGVASGDLDGDGDLDVIMNRLGSKALVLRNDSDRPRVSVRLRGTAPNTAAIGAKVRLRGGPVELQEKEVTAGGLYLSSPGPTLSFAAGDAQALRLEVVWRDGTRSLLEDVRPGREYEVFQEEITATPAEPPESAGSPLFVDVSERLGHRHREGDFNDFQRQPLLIQRYSRLGPSLAWADLEGDGDPDLVIPEGSEGDIAIFENRAGEFERRSTDRQPNPLDLAGVVAVPDGAGGRRLLVAQSSYQAGVSDAPSAVLQVGWAGSTTAVVAGPDSSVAGPLALADVNGDGSLDLLVGGRMIPRRIPRAASSRLFLAEGDTWREDAEAADVLDGVGMVSGTTFSDVDVDGDPDLLLAVEWGSPRLLVNEGGQFEDRTEAWGLAGLTGRWNGVATGDFNEDGRPDVVLTGWGRNLTPRPEPDRPLVLYHGDFDRNGRWDMIPAQAPVSGGEPMPLARFGTLRFGLPSIRDRIESFTQYSVSTMAEVLGADPSDFERLEAATYDHLLLLSGDGGFEVRPLPQDAQLAPAFGAVVTDLDGDGHEDLFIAQNFYPTQTVDARLDAGRGLVLLGDGTGSLAPLSGSRSGIVAFGDQRGAAAADFDRDGRVDLAVGQVGAETKLFHNVSAVPGLRVSVSAGPRNPDGIGVGLRVHYADGSVGPLREIQGGSGYGSFDDPLQVLGLAGAPVAVEVSWPGGTSERVPVPAGQTELRISR